MQAGGSSGGNDPRSNSHLRGLAEREDPIENGRSESYHVQRVVIQNILHPLTVAECWTFLQEMHRIPVSIRFRA